MDNKIWKGRIKKDMNKEVEKFTFSIDLDKNLYLYDIKGTAAHAAGLYKIGIITRDELKEIFYGLEKVKKNIEEDKIDILAYEDIHSLVENELGKITGNAARKIKKGRAESERAVSSEQ